MLVVGLSRNPDKAVLGLDEKSGPEYKEWNEAC